MNQLSLIVFIIPFAALLLMIILVVYLKKRAGNQQCFMRLFRRIAVYSFILNLAWEMLQMPLFLNMSLNWQSAQFCVLASVADTIMVLLIYYALASFYKNNWWMMRPKPQRLMTLVITGASGAVLAELRHITWRTWIYSTQMPMIPGLNVGVAPVLQFMLLPAFIYFLALSFNQKNLNNSSRKH